MKWIKKITGLHELIDEQKKTNQLLEKIETNSKRSANALEKYNKAYHI